MPNAYEPVALWLTGLPCAGKSTIAGLAADRLRARGRSVTVLDGDELRRTTSSDLGFSADDRCEQARRAATQAAEVLARGDIAIVALVSPLRRARDAARAVLGDAFLEIYVDAPLTVCESRDVKGLYEKARQGLVGEFTGVSAPFEAPEAPALRLDTAVEGPEESALRVVDMLAR